MEEAGTGSLYEEASHATLAEGVLQMLLVVEAAGHRHWRQWREDAQEADLLVADLEETLPEAERSPWVAEGVLLAGLVVGCTDSGVASKGLAVGQRAV